MSSTKLSPPTQASPRVAWKEHAERAWAVLNSAGLAALNALLLAATVLLLIVPDRSVLTGVAILVWGAGASFIAFGIGSKDFTNTKGQVVVVSAYAATTLLVYVLLNGLYRLFGA